jgi:hypothetical protein
LLALQKRSQKNLDLSDFNLSFKAEIGEVLNYRGSMVKTFFSSSQENYLASLGVAPGCFAHAGRGTRITSQNDPIDFGFVP